MSSPQRSLTTCTFARTRSPLALACPDPPVTPRRRAARQSPSSAAEFPRVSALAHISTNKAKAGAVTVSPEAPSCPAESPAAVRGAEHTGRGAGRPPRVFSGRRCRSKAGSPPHVWGTSSTGTRGPPASAGRSRARSPAGPNSERARRAGGARECVRRPPTERDCPQRGDIPESLEVFDPER